VVALGCARPPVPAPRPGLSPQARLERAAALVREGCLDCLIEARDGYAALRADPGVGPDAGDAEVKTLVLIALREDTLGLLPGRWLEEAAALAAASPRQAALQPFVDFGRAFLGGSASGVSALASDVEAARRFRFTSQQGPRIAASLRSQVPGDLHAAALWFELACTAAPRDLPDREARLEVVAPLLDVPLLEYRRMNGCPVPERARGERMLERNPRFVEINYDLGLRDLAGRLRASDSVVRPDLDSAMRRLDTALAWRPQWPALLLVLANLALTAEDFDASVGYYDRALALVPNHPGALLGRLRALTYANRPAEAIAVADTLLSLNRNPGDALYWRAYNGAQLERNDQAWDDIEQAERLLINADVPKLAGIIAINRRDYAVARARLELAISRRSSGCDAQFYLQAVLAELREWTAAASGAAAAGSCLDSEITALASEVERLRAEAATDLAQARLIPRREAQLEGDRRMRATTWFNAAVASFNLQRIDDARVYALKVVDDPRFAARAKDLIARLGAGK
jgi:tetratricopeptide (TPR) repeat protein